jgi:hypothetical protein
MDAICLPIVRCAAGVASKSRDRAYTIVESLADDETFAESFDGVVIPVAEL